MDDLMNHFQLGYCYGSGMNSINSRQRPIQNAPGQQGNRQTYSVNLPAGTPLSKRQLAFPLNEQQHHNAPNVLPRRNIFGSNDRPSPMFMGGNHFKRLVPPQPMPPQPTRAAIDPPAVNRDGALDLPTLNAKHVPPRPYQMNPMTPHQRLNRIDHSDRPPLAPRTLNVQNQSMANVLPSSQKLPSFHIAANKPSHMNMPRGAENIPITPRRRTPNISLRLDPIVPFAPAAQLNRVPCTPLNLARAALNEPLQRSNDSATKEELKILLHLYFRSRASLSLRLFCKHNAIRDSIRQQMLRIINKHEMLKVLETERGLDEKRNQAMEIINTILPGPNFYPPSEATQAPSPVQATVQTPPTAPTRASAPSNSSTFIHPDDKIRDPKHIAEIARGLDFSAEPRIARGGDKEIRMHNQKEPSERARALMLTWFRGATTLHPNLSQFQKSHLLEDVATIVMYDFGYKEAKHYKQLIRNWEPRVLEYFKTGVETAPLKSRNQGRRAYNDMIEESHPKYIHKVYRHAVREVGTQASFKKLAEVMNRLSQGPEYDDKPNLTLTKAQLWRHFNQFRGKLKSPLEKPYKTDKQKEETLAWVRKVKRTRASKRQKFHICFIDEKWFYTHSRRKKNKILPPHPDGEDEDVEEFVRTTVSRRHPIKVS